MRVAMSLDLSAFVTARIANYAAEATESYQVSEAASVAEFHALPLIRHWFETIGLRADGEIVQWSTDDSLEPFQGAKPVDERYFWLSALVVGAKRYPELQTLLPIRGMSTVDCQCVAHPIFAVGKVLCSECCGLGWVENPK